ncbi:MAG: hypothetical protein ABMB14_03665, partial [Myxococcota bacterium]
MWLKIAVAGGLAGCSTGTATLDKTTPTFPGDGDTSGDTDPYTDADTDTDSDSDSDSDSDTDSDADADTALWIDTSDTGGGGT